MKTTIVLYIATTKDGFIAGVDGNLDWLPKTLQETGGKDYGYQQFYDSIDATAMGRKTYQDILSFGDWPYIGKKSYIFSGQPLETSNKDIEFYKGDIQGFIKKMEEEKIKNLWLVGGAGLAESFYDQGRIDEYIITEFPVSIGQGIPLTTVDKALKNGKIIKLNSIDFGDGVFQHHYKSKL